MKSAVYFVIYQLITLTALFFPQFSILCFILLASTAVIHSRSNGGLVGTKSTRFYLHNATSGIISGNILGGIFAGISTVAAFIMMIILKMIPAILILYFAVMLTAYIIPTARYIYWRAKLYGSLKKKAEEKNYRFDAKFFDILFSGRRKPYTVTVVGNDETYSLTILGTVGEMRYIFQNDDIISQRINPVARENVIELDYLAENSEFEFLASLAKHSQSKKISVKWEKPVDGKKLLLLQPNSYFMADGKIISLGEMIGEHRIVDITNAAKLVI